MKIKSFIYILAGAFLLSGCDDWLNVPSKTILSEEDIAKYPELVESQFFANYSELRKSVHSIGDGAMSYRQHPLFSFTDEGANNTPWGNGTMSRNPAGRVFGGIFSQSSKEAFQAVWPYKEINIINKFILQYKNNEAMKSMVGEAYFIRAFYYFEMVKRYGGVPLYSGSIDEVKVLNNRATEDASWEYVRLCLDSAIVRLPETQNVASEDKDRANKYTALSLKSRAMLYAGTIAQKNKVFNNALQGVPLSRAQFYLSEAAEAAAKVINSNKYTLSSNFEDLFNGKDENNNEIIFRFTNRAKSGVVVYHDYWNQSFRIKQSGYTAFGNPTIDVVNQFETLNGEIKDIFVPGDVRSSFEDFFANRDKRLAASIIYPGGTYLGEKFEIYKKVKVKKANGSTTEYQYASASDLAAGTKVPNYDFTCSGIDGVFNSTGANGTTQWGFFTKKMLYGVKKLEDYLTSENDQDAVVIRYGEVILNFAEAAFELADKFGADAYKAQAQQVLDNLRSVHGGLPAKKMTREVIRHERFIDLMYEGFRYWDLKRWDIGVATLHQKVMRPLWPVINIDETKTPAAITYSMEYGAEPTHLETRIKWFEERDNYSPLPVDKAPGIKQNDQWN